MGFKAEFGWAGRREETAGGGEPLGAGSGVWGEGRGGVRSRRLPRARSGQAGRVLLDEHLALQRGAGLALGAPRSLRVCGGVSLSEGVRGRGGGREHSQVSLTLQTPPSAPQSY